MNIAPNSTLLFIGDSITDCGRARPVGEGRDGGLGGGYVALVAALLAVASPDRAVRVLNTGVSGNTVRDLISRWQTDVLDLRPDWLSVCIGINDVWRQFDSPNNPSAGVPLSEYETTLDELLASRPAPNLVLMTPFFIEPNADPMRAMMDTYGAAVKRLADKHGALLVDTQAAFDRLLVHMPSSVLAGDRVHPNQTGHLALARAFLEAVGFAW